MADAETLKEALERGGSYAVWELMNEDERREAATALWENADHAARAALETALAKDLKFRPRSVHRLPAERLAGRLVRMAESLPDAVLFQFLFHLHMAGRRPLMVELLDAVGLPHDNGVLELEDKAEPPAEDQVVAAATKLLAAHGHQAAVYLATLRVADRAFWKGLDGVLAGLAGDGSPIA